MGGGALSSGAGWHSHRNEQHCREHHREPGIAFARSSTHFRRPRDCNGRWSRWCAGRRMAPWEPRRVAPGRWGDRSLHSVVRSRWQTYVAIRWGVSEWCARSRTSTAREAGRSACRPGAGGYSLIVRIRVEGKASAPAADELEKYVFEEMILNRPERLPLAQSASTGRIEGS